MGISTVERFTYLTLQPARYADFALLDAIAFAPNVTVAAGQAIAINSTSLKAVPYSGASLFQPTGTALTTATTGGTLAAGTYGYRVSATNGAGETIPAAEVTIVVPAGTSTNAVTVTWNPVAGATGYNVYGRTASGELKMATLSGYATNTYTDTGTVTPSGAIPSSNTATVSDGSQTAVGLSVYSLSTDAAGKVYRTSGAAAGNVPSANYRIVGEDTSPYYFCGIFKTSDLTNVDANALTTLKATTLPNGDIRIP